MIRRLTNKEVCNIPTKKGLFHCVISRIKNDVNGNPRYEVIIFQGVDDIARVYRAGGYGSIKSICENVVNNFIGGVNND